MYMTKYESTLKGYDENKTMKENMDCYKEAWNHYLVVLYLQHSDQSKYGSLVNGLKAQYALDNNQYPLDLTAARSVLNNHKFDPTYNENKRKKKNREQENNNDNPDLQFAQSGWQALAGKCYCCGKAGHRSTECNDKRPREQWEIHKIKNQQHVQEQQNKDDDDKPGWHVSHTQLGCAITSRDMEMSLAQLNNDMKDVILLDNQSSVDLFCNKDLVKGITDGDKELFLATNAGTATINKTATVPDYGKVWYDEKAITNIFSLGKMTDKHRVTFDSDIEDAFIVHLNDKDKAKFERNDKNLYVYRPKPKKKVEFAGVGIDKDNNESRDDKEYQLLDTVEDNEMLYSQRQLDKAKKARNLLHTLGCPTIRDLKNIITMNGIRDCDVTLEDIDTAEQIFGKDVASLKGKTVRQKVAPVVHNVVSIPPELMKIHHNIELCIDTLFVNGLPFLTTISKNIKYRTATFLETRTKDGYYKAIDEVFKLYNDAGFTIKIICADNEFKPIFDAIKHDLGVTMRYAPAEGHNPEAERNNRTIEERVRAQFHVLPFESVPKTLTKWMVAESPRKLNFFPPRGGVSKYYSPRVLLSKEPLDYNKDCKYAFGTYVQAHCDPDPKNTNDARTLDCLYLRPRPHGAGHTLLDIHTQRVISRNRVTPIPMTRSVIAVIESWAEAEDQKGLQIKTKRGEILYDSSWTAGVDFVDPQQPAREPVNNNDNNNTVNDDNDENEENEDNDIIQNDTDDTVEPEPEEEQEETEENLDENELAETNDPIQEEVVDARDDEEPQDEPQEEEEPEGPPLRRSERATRQPEIWGKEYSHTQIHVQDGIEVDKTTTYDMNEAFVMAQYIDYINNTYKAYETGEQFLIQYSLKKGLKMFGDKGHEAAHKEIKQLHDRVCFQPINFDKLTPLEKKRVLNSLMFLVEKKDGKIKARKCANGSKQRNWLSNEDTASPTVMTQSTCITCTIDAKEGREVMTCDLPNAFIQSKLPEYDKDGARYIMTVKGPLVDYLLQINSVLYEKHVVIEKGEKVLYLQVLRPIYGMLESALLFYKKVVKDLKERGFTINPYDPCVANMMVNGKQLTVQWHVDDMKMSHMEKEVLEDLVDYLQYKYGLHGDVTTSKGKIHTYLGMKLDYSTPGECKLDMIDYVKDMLKEFPFKSELNGMAVTSQANENLFKVNKTSGKITMDKAQLFHTFVAKGLFLCKRARPDIQTAIALMCTRVKDPRQDDWYKLIRLMKWLSQTRDDCLTLRAEQLEKVYWYIDAAFAVHDDFKSHTGVVMTFGEDSGAVISMSCKQKVNTRSSTEAELMAVDDAISQILLTKFFMEEQGYPTEVTLYQDNRSAMLLENNGRSSAGKRSRHLNIKYFYITDQVEQGLVKIEYCPTDLMKADFLTKALHGKKMKKFRSEILNIANE